MLNAIPAINLFGASNPLLEQTNLVKVPSEIRTQNFERISARSVEEVKKNAKSRSSGKEHSEDEEESEGENEEPYPQPQHKPTIQERLVFAKQEKVSLNQRAVTALFLNRATSDGGRSKRVKPSIDVVA